MMPIYYINRETGKKEIEKVFGQKWIDFAYQNKLGFLFTDYILSQPFFSKIYGFLKSTKWSANNIQNFIKNYEIKINFIFVIWSLPNGSNNSSCSSK